MKAEDYDPLEKLAILAPHAIDLRHIPTEWQHLTSSDVAGRLSSVSEAAALLGRIKVAGENHLYNKLLIHLKVKIAGCIIKPGTNSKERPLVDLMAKLALEEVIHPKICKWCKGRGWIPCEDRPEKTEECGSCRGGRYAYTEHARARACNIHHEEWRRKYSRIYIEVLTIPLEWEHDVREALKC